jgi:hypothetical protein
VKFITDVKQKNSSVFIFIPRQQTERNRKKTSKTANELDLNTLLDHLEQIDDIYRSIEIRYELFVNLLEDKYDGALSAYQAYDVVRMMVKITIFMLNMST